MLTRAEALQGTVHAGGPHAQAYRGKTTQVHSEDTFVCSVDFINDYVFFLTYQTHVLHCVPAV